MAAAYTAGGSLAATGVKKAGREIGEEIVEQTVKHADDIIEAGAKQADEVLEAGAKKGTKEAAEALAKPKGPAGKVVTKTKPPKKRPSWRQSEKDVAKNYPDHKEQISFKDGKEVPYGTKGSTRPDLYRKGESIEVKNYKVEDCAGRSRLKRELVRQYKDRVENLPKGTKQKAIIDVRGQNISAQELKKLKKSINSQAKNLEVIFMFN